MFGRRTGITTLTMLTAIIGGPILALASGVNVPEPVGDGSFEISCDATRLGQCEYAAVNACHGRGIVYKEMMPSTRSGGLFGGRPMHIRNFRFWCR